MVCDDSEAAQLCTRATRRQNYRERTGLDTSTLAREKDNRLRRVSRRTAAKYDHMVRLELNNARRTRSDGLDIWIRLHVEEYLIFRTCPIQIIGDISYLAARNHKLGGTHKDTPRTANASFSIYSDNRRKFFYI